MLDEGRAAEPRAGGQVERILYLKQLPVIGTLPSSDLALVADRMHERFFKKGEWLLREGEPARAFYAVIDGNLHVSREKNTIGHTKAGGVVGGFAIIGRDPRGLSVRAEADTLALEVEAEAVSDILEDNFGIMHHVLRDIARQLISLIARQPNPWAYVPIPSDPGMARPRELDLVERIFFMRTSSPFKRASINALAELSRGFTEVRAEPGTTLWTTGDPSAFVSLLVSGEVTCTTPGGVAQLLGPDRGHRRSEFGPQPGAFVVTGDGYCSLQRSDAGVRTDPGIDLTGEYDRGRGRPADYRRIGPLHGQHGHIVVQLAREHDERSAVISRDDA